MNTEQIEKVIESIAKSGYTPKRKTHIDKHISLDYGRCKFTLNYKGDQLIVGVTIQISRCFRDGSATSRVISGQADL